MFGPDLINTIRKEKFALRPYTINKSWDFCYPKTMGIKPNKRAIRVKHTKKDTLTSALFVIRLGLEPKTPTLKVFRSSTINIIYTSCLQNYEPFVGYAKAHFTNDYRSA